MSVEPLSPGHQFAVDEFLRERDGGPKLAALVGECLAEGLLEPPPPALSREELLEDLTEHLRRQTHAWRYAPRGQRAHRLDVHPVRSYRQRGSSRQLRPARRTRRATARSPGREPDEPDDLDDLPEREAL